MQDQGKIASIDMVRGIAILGVITHHTAYLAGELPTWLMWLDNFSQMGVQLFFVASALTLCMSATHRAEPNWTGFFVRRIFRIAPLYYAAILVYFFWHLLKEFYKQGALVLPDGYTLWAVLSNLTFTHGFSPDHFNYVVPGGWSIAAEMTFYVLFPLIFLAVLKGPKALVLALLAALAIGVGGQMTAIEWLSPILVERGVLTDPMVNDGFGFLYASLLTQLPVFLIGCLAFVWRAVAVRSGHILAAGAFVLASLFLQNSSLLYTTYIGALTPTLAAAGFGILVVWLMQQTRAPGRLGRRLAWIGQLSFSMYICHFIIVDICHLAFARLHFDDGAHPVFLLIMSLAFVTILSASVAVFSRQWIEAPGIALGKRLARMSARDWLVRLGLRAADVETVAHVAAPPQTGSRN